MERIAAIVEGHTEEHFVRSTYGAARITRAIPNGRTVDPGVIVDAVLDALELVSGSVTKVLILFDREGRAETAEALAAEVRDGVAARCGDRVLYVGVSDRQIENWVVADEAEMQLRFNAGYEYGGDGCSGKVVLRDLNGGVSLGPKDTAELLKACSASCAAVKSVSLASFLRQIDFDWNWATS